MRLLHYVFARFVAYTVRTAAVGIESLIPPQLFGTSLLHNSFDVWLFSVYTLLDTWRPGHRVYIQRQCGMARTHADSYRNSRATTAFIISHTHIYRYQERQDRWLYRLYSYPPSAYMYSFQCVGVTTRYSRWCVYGVCVFIISGKEYYNREQATADISWWIRNNQVDCAAHCIIYLCAWRIN